MKKMANYCPLCMFFLLFPMLSIAQLDTTSLSSKRPAYLGIEFGIEQATFRDFASSPLFYVGHPITVALSHIDCDEERASSIRLSYAFGNLKTTAVQTETVSNVQTFMVNYLELFELPQLSSSTVNLKLGGQFNATANLRTNEALGNNSDGFELISTLFASAKGTINLSSKKAKLKRSLAFGLHIGLINTSYRNGFIYTRQSPLLNEDHINDGYEFRIFSGYRINSNLAYTFWLKNGNAMQFSYRWDAYKTGRNQDEFEMATHRLTLSLLFNLKS